MMAKKKSKPSKADKSDPRHNRRLAVRNVIKKMPSATAKEVVEAVKKEYGHQVSTNMVYMARTKSNMASDGRPTKAKGESDSPMNSAEVWVEAIQSARHLLTITGSVANATALLKALAG
jgi:hypothetical protein